MAMDRQEFLDLCQAHAIGLLDGEDLARFRRELASADAENLAAWRSASEAAANLSLAAPDAGLSPSVLNRLMKRVGESKPGSSPASPSGETTDSRRTDAGSASAAEKTRIAWLMPFRFAAIAAVGMSLVIVGLLSYVSTLRTDLGLKGIEAAQGRQRIEALEDTLAQREAMLDVLRSSQMQMVVMKGQEADPIGYGKIIWDPIRKKAILHVSNLPAQAADKDYQLWVIRDSKPVDAGVFQVNGTREGGELYKIDQLVEADRSRISAFAITLEPKGGLPQPSGKMYLLGSI